MAIDPRFAVPMHGANYYSGSNGPPVLTAAVKKAMADAQAKKDADKQKAAAKASADAAKAKQAAAAKEKQQAAALKKQGIDANGRPIRPDFKSANNKQGTVQSQYDLSKKLKTVGDVQSIVPELDKRLQGATVNEDAINGLRNEALRTGPSAWMSNELARNEAQTNYQLGDIGAANAKAAADARSQLASKNGLSSGAAERLAGAAGKNTIAEQQNLRRQANLGNMALSSQDEMNRMNALGQLQGAEQNLGQFNLTKAGIPIQQLANEQGMNRTGETGNVTAYNNAKQYDISNALKDIGSQNDFSGNVYNQMMGEYGAEKTAQAMANSANQENPGLLGSGGFLGTGLGTNHGILGTGIGGNSTGGKITGAATGALIGSAIMPGVGTLAGGAIGGALSCFIKGEKFLLSDGSEISVENITPDHELLDGGQTYAAAQFKGQRIYDYKGILVDGSHAVLEDGRWVRVEASPLSKRRPDKDGEIVYVVWNQYHRMVHKNGTVFADYAETDNTDSVILHHKNLEELNLQ
jgi:hypothetical protein